MQTNHKVVILFMLAAAFTAAVTALSACDGGVEDIGIEEATESASLDTDEPVSDLPEEDDLYTAEYEPTGNEMAVIKTPKGEIRFEFYVADAPNTVAAFIELADAGFYDGTKFHRVEPGFVIQGGDPLSKTDDSMVGTGNPGYRLRAEFNDRQHLDGTVAMARSADPDSAGSQFYICLGPQPFLDGNYTVFGQVVDGLDVVHSTEVGDIMDSVRIERPE